MKTYAVMSLIILGVLLTRPTLGFGDTHTIGIAPGLKWSYKGQASKMIVVDDLRIGDIIEVTIPNSGVIHHGFTTIRKDPPPIKPAPDLVLKCGEAASATPDAVPPVLKEIECGEESRFGVEFHGTMKLEILPTFAGEVPFWCVRHTDGMQGVLKLKANR